jgi:hypothetical protein
MTKLDQLTAASPKVRAEALRLLDQVSAPLDVREIEHALRQYGVSKSQRTVIANALAHLDIIAIRPLETGHD